MTSVETLFICLSYTLWYTLTLAYDSSTSADEILPLDNSYLPSLSKD